MKTVQAVNDKVVVEILKQKEATNGGIIVPENVINEPQLYGRVMSVGENITTINPGDTLLFHRNGGQDIVLDRRVIKVLSYAEVYGILKDEEYNGETVTL
jgi:co-chaperonin GroES (HSP10)